MKQRLLVFLCCTFLILFASGLFPAAFRPLLFAASDSTAQAVLKNPDFSQWENAIPVSWSPQGNAVKLQQVDSGLKCTVLRETELAFSLLQRFKPDTPNQAFVLQGRMTSDEPGLAFLQAKMYKKGKEIRRVGAQLNDRGTTDVKFMFAAGSADVVEINCRVVTRGKVGASVVFSPLTLTVLDGTSMLFWKPRPGNMRFESNDNHFELELRTPCPDGVCLEHEIMKPVNGWPSSEMQFDGIIQTDYVEIACLQVDLFQDSKKLATYTSPKNRFATDHCSVRFPVGQADCIVVSCRFPGDEIYNGQRVWGKEIYFGKPREISFTPKEHEIELVPGYQVCSVSLLNCLGRSQRNFSSSLLYREQGEEQWQSAYPPVYEPAQRAARGTIVHLKEETTYDIKLEYTDSGRSGHVTRSFTTQSVRVPIAKTIELTQADLPIDIQKSGKPDGYIRYTCKPGTTLDCGDTSVSGFAFKNVSYVILENMTIKGGQIDAIRLDNCSNIQIINCDIFGFGQIGQQRIDYDGKYYMPGSKRYLNNHAGIRVWSCKNILVERCYIHDPRGTANSWFYSHPAGPNAVFVYDTAGLALRFNDFIGSDLKRWNDVVEGGSNGSNIGSVRKDAEICGNYLAFGNDDGMELDGGQINCRFFYNRTEGCLCGVSTAPCRVGPSWLFGNLFCNPGDEFDFIGAGFKNGYGHLGLGRLHFFNNTIYGYGTAFNTPGGPPEEYDAVASQNMLKAVSRNNIAACNTFAASALFDKLRSDFDYDLIVSGNSGSMLKSMRKINQEQHGIAADANFQNVDQGLFSLTADSPARDAGTMVPNFAPWNKPHLGAFVQKGPQAIPYRPAPFTTDISSVSIDQSSNSVGLQTVSLFAEGSQPVEFNIAQPEGAAFFDVSPRHGQIVPGTPTTLTVSSCPQAIGQPRRNTSAFRIATSDGFSRCVSVVVDSRANVALLKKIRQGAIYGEVRKGKNGESEAVFDVPKKGEFWIFILTESPDTRCRMIQIDDGKPIDRILLRPNGVNKPWRNVSSNTFSDKGPNKPFELAPGRHVIRFMTGTKQVLALEKAVLVEDANAMRLSAVDLP
ncbi:MAG: right-handed parallel beta-helix repeat-containing protein [Thermoguttaceae bacterium]|nr:right-handed parallel beta-helix repeat-containing protein [Thermoguttaceae bacterium]